MISSLLVSGILQAKLSSQTTPLAVLAPSSSERWFTTESNTVKWSDASKTTNSYQIWLDRGNGKPTKLGSVGKTSRSFTWTTTGPATETASIKVTALDSKGGVVSTANSGSFLVVLPATTFSGMTWTVRSMGTGDPGPNNWDPHAVWVDSKGFLHLRIFRSNGTWKCGEIFTTKKFGFGQYRFWLDGRVDLQDKNIVLGLFPYPTPDVGPDGTHEIDIEFSRWGGSSPIGNYTVWPTKAILSAQTFPFDFGLQGDFTTHVMTRSSKSVLFQSLNGHYNDNTNEFKRWLFAPNNAAAQISQAAMPLHINFWLFRGRPPTEGKEAEVVIEKVSFS